MHAKSDAAAKDVPETVEKILAARDAPIDDAPKDPDAFLNWLQS
jgi:hypothetical protein